MMCSVKVDFVEYPQWYSIEKETGKTIDKLTNTKELAFYLKNSNEFIRRLAILRINHLKLKDSINVLMEVMDDLLESDINKELAAWTIKSIISKWGLELFINHRILNKYTGNEKTLGIMSLKIEDKWSDSLKFEFSETFLKDELESDTENLRQNEDLQLEFNFSPKEWFLVLSEQIAKNIRDNWMRVPGIVVRLLRKLAALIIPILIILPVKAVFRGFNRLIQVIKNKSRSKNYTNHSKNKTDSDFSINLLDSTAARKPYRDIRDQKAGFMELMKNAAFNVVYVILTPLRLVLRYRKWELAVLVLLYLFFTYTYPGRVFVHKYTGMDLQEKQSQVLKYSKTAVNNMVFKAEGIFKSLYNSVIIASPEPAQVIEKTPVPHSQSKQLKFIVTAKKGLNLRQAPDSTSNKPAIGLLKYNSTVVYLNKSQTDKNGVKWYLIKATNGKQGWASSKYLKEIRSDM
ncbi:MAG TPA: SH3 domain-containing protein [Pseudobacteroides sp.]|uniref:SH3 domain-containing protein n=1 Tax=Pseudobacteroides sp. TaxID=1968840 RepID=UPI002F926A61